MEQTKEERIRLAFELRGDAVHRRDDPVPLTPDARGCFRFPPGIGQTERSIVSSRVVLAALRKDNTPPGWRPSRGAVGPQKGEVALDPEAAIRRAFGLRDGVVIRLDGTGAPAVADSRGYVREGALRLGFRPRLDRVREVLLGRKRRRLKTPSA